ncbi:MAG TPA: serine hydrolase domain-containing protein [Saprospiraceae bacterium]|nr:serine hydrolase domain-containing protein [Saprospiraceae bacterium]
MGLLSLDDPLSKYFDNVPSDKSRITIHQLLTHTAGFEDAIGDDYDNVDANAFAALAFASPLLFPPGAQYNYSNVGYSMLGIIITKVSGKGYEEFLHEQLWKPAGMMQTGYLMPGHTPAVLAVGYRDGERWGTAIDRPWSSDGPGWHLRANGGILSTVGDMYRWYVALRNHTALAESAVKQMLTPYVAEGPEGQSFYGYGWVVQDFDGKRMIWHNGGNGVYNAIMSFVLSDDICIIVSSNSNTVISDDISLQLLGIVWGKELRSNAEEEPYRNNAVTMHILHVIREEGVDFFYANSEKILKDAGFDFENDMQLLGAGEQLMEAEQWEEGIALYTVYTSLFPRIVVAWNHLGRCKKAIGDVTGAKSAWEKSVTLRPQNNPAAKWLHDLQ